MKKIVSVVILAAVSATLFTSCKKYEEGPKVSLRSKKARLAGEWVVDHYVDGGSGTVINPSGNGYMAIEKDGKVTNYDGSGGSYVGTWEFATSKEQIKWSYTSGPITITETQNIILLKNDEIAFEDIDDGDKTYYKAK